MTLGIAYFFIKLIYLIIHAKAFPSRKCETRTELQEIDWDKGDKVTAQLGSYLNA